MRQQWIRGFLVIAVVSTGALAVSAAEQGGPSMERKDASASAPSSQPPSSSAPTASAQPLAVPTPSPSTPQASTTKTAIATGSITAIDLKSTPPTLKLAAADGNVLTITLDPKSTAVWQKSQEVTLDQLKVDQQVTVRYLLKDGREVAQSIRVVQQPNKPTSSAQRAPTSY
ncbi:MAG: hypothetical protein HYZ91_05440 [Candidatus Omnitrophica bacterium]|nr:hypothetical protein [Candidatus Omnitrophota bacterium]